MIVCVTRQLFIADGNSEGEAKKLAFFIFWNVKPSFHRYHSTIAGCSIMHHIQVPCSIPQNCKPVTNQEECNIWSWGWLDRICSTDLLCNIAFSSLCGGDVRIVCEQWERASICWMLCRNYVTLEDLQPFLPARKAEEAFAMLDRNGDGQVTLMELRTAIQEVLK